MWRNRVPDGVILTLLLTIVASCSQHNPASCCVTDQQCIMLGLAQMYQCAGEQVCDTSGTCVAAECTVSEDCPAKTPFCLGHLCTEACTSNDDCVADPTHPLCASDGACVGCLDSTGCPSAMAICDQTTRECRGCTTGADCASLVCDTSVGVCEDSSIYAYISTNGADTSNCIASAPCRTLAYALTQLGGRTNIWIVGSSFVTSSTLTLGTASVTIRSDHATITGTAMPLVEVPGGSAQEFTLRSTTIDNTSGSTSVAVISGTLTLDDVTVKQGFSVDAGAILDVTGSELDGGGTSAGTTTIKSSTTRGEIMVTGGIFRYDSNRFEGTAGRAITSSTPNVQIVDSVFISSTTSGPVISLGKNESIAFSTFINLQTSTSPAVVCTGNPQPGVLGSIIDGWNNQIGTCSVSSSLFSGTSAPVGTGNLFGNIAGFFVDLAGQDLRLSATSAALRAGSGSLPGADHDITGGARPMPASTNPDVGAYESPN